ncbi:homoserine dehydrogenase [Bacillus sp. CGMCC 1.16607]|uniref:homoserine dehydrogenase n=1 Tax=Bacillus sp. CGMCC 1.16607 TaxID=3351842 RepID=UPI0036399725
MKKIKVALLGLGTVGFGTYTALTEREEKFASLIGKTFEITGILIKDEEKPREIDKQTLITTCFEYLFLNEAPDVVIEVMGGIEPAFSYIKRALQSGCHVVSANKDLIAKHGKELRDLASAHHVRFVYEASVAGGIPILRTIKELLVGNQIENVEGILNGTSNFILSNMRTAGASFEKALELAQQKGYAESDPTNDIEGIDAFFKAMVLCDWIFGRQPDWKQVNVEGITNITIDEIQLASQLGLRVKHLVLINSDLHVEIKPVFVDSDHPLYGVENVDNAIRLKTDILGYLTLQGAGAGAEATSSAVIEDLLSIYLTKPINREVNINTVNTSCEKQSDGQKIYLLFYDKSQARSEELYSQLAKYGTILTTGYQSSSKKSYILYKGSLKEYESLIHFKKYEVKVFNHTLYANVVQPEFVNEG